MQSAPRGYNHDVRYRGQVFHVQSEVSGGRRGHACTQLFSRGAVLATERSTLAEGMSDSDIATLLQTQHKAVLHELCRGTFDAWLAGDAAPDSAAEPDMPVPARHSVPGQVVQLKRRGLTLEMRGTDDVAACEILVEVRHGDELVATRRVAYETCERAEVVAALMSAELESMAAKLRRGGLDARLPAAAFVFVAPPIPRMSR